MLLFFLLRRNKVNTSVYPEAHGDASRVVAQPTHGRVHLVAALILRRFRSMVSGDQVSRCGALK